MQKCCLLIVCVVVCLGAHATNYYIDSAKGNNNFSGLSPAKAYKTIQKGADQTNAGDTVFIMNGSYSPFIISRPGTASAQIVYTNYPGHKPKVISTSNTYGVISVRQGANYIAINGLEVVGYGVNLNLATDTIAAQAAVVCPVANDTATSTVFIPKYNGGGILVGANDTSAQGCHHIVISNNVVHDCAAGGIGFGHTDYITVEGNTCYNNSWYTPYGTSGIGFGYSYNYDNNTTTYRTIVRNNVCYGNRLYVVWRRTCTISDGNGIILDIPQAGYKGRILVANNICFNNGGTGIHALSTSHVDFYNNICYLNNASPQNGGGSLFGFDADSLNFYNNIIVSRPGKNVLAGKRVTHVAYDYNIYYGGKPFNFTDLHSFVQDPLFINASTDPKVANFHLQPGSFAINNGSNTHTTPTDKDTIARPMASIVDIGAYETNYTGSQNTCNIGLQAKIIGNGTGTGEGNATTYYGPFDTKPDSVNQQSRKAIIYPDTLFKNIPANATLSSLQFKRANQISPTITAFSTQVVPDSTLIRVYLRNEASDNFGAGTFDWATILPGAANPAILVYEGDAASFVGNTGGWRTVPFKTPFAYEGAHIGVFLEYVQKKTIAGATDINWLYDNGGSQAFYNTAKYPQMANAFKYTSASGKNTIGNSLMVSNERRPVMSFGYCTSPSALPVSIVQFNGKLKAGNAYLDWVVANEINNAGFDVQRSADGIGFNTIGFVASKAVNGNGSVNNYSFMDVAPLSDIGFYRLQQKDKDGQTSYSAIVSIANSGKPLSLRSIYPNPVSNNLYAIINIAEQNTVARFSIQDITGRVVSKFEKQLAAGQNKIAIDLSKLGAATYLLVVELPNGSRVASKFIKDK
ncbi:choice-of-anchor Q domain-containing protein [Parasediminibacterium sp. JCM 36343]|uniref:choice-of-anchor Q domain-containing protein n=1 Tax=Parasediminibacterium sp. JCM 36343 TaxID=3374279 RepID=UPI003979160E